MGIATLLGLVTALVGCSGGGDSAGGGGYCVGTFEGGDTGFGCTSCSGVDPFVDNPLPEAIDNNGRTYRGFGLDTNGSITITVAAPAGMSFPAGVDAGGLIRFPAGTPVSASYSLFNDNAPVVATSGATIAAGNTPPGAGSDTYYPVIPSATIDEIQLQISVTGNLSRAEFRLYEMCGDL